MERQIYPTKCKSIPVGQEGGSCTLLQELRALPGVPAPEMMPGACHSTATALGDTEDKAMR